MPRMSSVSPNASCTTTTPGALPSASRIAAGEKYAGRAPIPGISITRCSPMADSFGVGPPRGRRSKPDGRCVPHGGTHRRVVQKETTARVTVAGGPRGYGPQAGERISRTRMTLDSNMRVAEGEVIATARQTARDARHMSVHTGSSKRWRSSPRPDTFSLALRGSRAPRSDRRVPSTIVVPTLGREWGNHQSAGERSPALG